MGGIIRFAASRLTAGYLFLKGGRANPGGRAPPGRRACLGIGFGALAIGGGAPKGGRTCILIGFAAMSLGGRVKISPGFHRDDCLI